jgi:hypothetical protein
MYPSTTTPSEFLYPSTLAVPDLEPPSPEQDIEKVLSPGVSIKTLSEPDVPVDDVQEAEQDDALDEDQVNVEDPPTKTDEGSAERLTVGEGADGSEEPPPPPPPPQEVKINIAPNE